MKRVIVAVLLTALMLPVLFANGGGEAAEGGMKEYSIFLGYPKEDYPMEGTILGDYIEEQTGVKLDWEFIVGDLEQKVGILAASGDYPDAIAARNYSSVMYDAGALIPLDDLVESHGQKIQELYGDRMDLIRYGEEKNIYWFPQIMPYGKEIRQTDASIGLYLQKAVLEDAGWPEIVTVEQALDVLVAYMEKYPEINGNKTVAFTGLYDGWRWFPLANAPAHFSGHPNDGGWNIDWNGSKFVVSHPGITDYAKRIYKLYNRVYLAGGYDTESFVMDYDQYLAKLSTGSVLGFADQTWQFAQAQSILKEQGEDRWYVAFPAVLDSNMNPELEGPLSPQVSEGVGISVDCKDPEGLMEYFNFLADMDYIRMSNWGIQGEDYMVGSNGMFYRTDEQIEKWKNKDWVDYTFGQAYWVNLMRPDNASVMPDGNAFSPNNNAEVFKAQLKDYELEVLDAYGKDTWYEFMNTPDVKRESYYPAWTIRKESGSPEQIIEQKFDDLRRKYIPLLVMADAGQYDNVWNEFMNEFNKQIGDDFQILADFMQANVDARVEVYGGYAKVKAMD